MTATKPRRRNQEHGIKGVKSSVYLPGALFAWLVDYTARRGMSASLVISEALELYRRVKDDDKERAA